MKRVVRATSQAEREVATIAEWIAKTSPQGAANWLAAYDRMVERLEEQADACSSAPESPLLNRDIRQAFFRTSRGQFYRALFTIMGDEVCILGVRGPGLRSIGND